jgi:phenylacetate-coenzyme A ligase PaaK-like adenylate-forming protein
MNILPITQFCYFRKLYHLHHLKKHQWLESEDLIRLQEKRLKDLINHAYQNVPLNDEDDRAF